MCAINPLLQLFALVLSRFEHGVIKGATRFISWLLVMRLLIAQRFDQFLTVLEIFFSFDPLFELPLGHLHSLDVRASVLPGLFYVPRPRLSHIRLQISKPHLSIVRVFLLGPLLLLPLVLGFYLLDEFFFVCGMFVLECLRGTEFLFVAICHFSLGLLAVENITITL